jgi:hypothetical protein
MAEIVAPALLSLLVKVVDSIRAEAANSKRAVRLAGRLERFRTVLESIGGRRPTARQQVGLDALRAALVAAAEQVDRMRGRAYLVRVIQSTVDKKAFDDITAKLQEASQDLSVELGLQAADDLEDLKADVQAMAEGLRTRSLTGRASSSRS